MEFDFEEDVKKMLPPISNEANSSDLGSFKVGDQKHRIIVCRHWLLGLCHNGSSCSYLHRLDKSKMPPCKHGDMCKIKNCPLKHVGDEELEECLFYSQGFCYNGPKCGRRHVKRMPEQCPLEPSFEAGGGTAAAPGVSKKARTNQPNDNFKVTLCTHWLLNGSCPFGGECHFAHGEDEINEGYQPNIDFLSDQDIYDPTREDLSQPLDLPFPATTRLSYFILQAPDLRSLSIAKRRGVWVVPSRIAAEMNAAFRASEHVILYFCVRPLRAIYGIAKLAAMIPPSPMGSLLTTEFSITWMRTLRVSLRTIAQLKLGMSGMFVGRSSSDGRFDNKVGLDMLLTAFRKPEWDWSLELERAEKNIRVSESSGGPSGQSGEYYPAAGTVPYFLPPDVLFAQDWADRMAASTNEKGVTFGNNKYSAGGGGYNNTNSNSSYKPPVVEFYSGSLPGFVFCAATAVVEEMFARRLFGLPLQMQESIIHPNVPLFVFDTQRQVLLGIFHADSPKSMNLDPTAFMGWGGMGCALPVQLKFRIALEVPPVPIQDTEVRAALGQFAQALGGPLGPAETKNLANLMARRAAVVRGGGVSGKDRGHKTGGFEKRGSQFGPHYYKPPFPFVDVVPIDIPGNAFDIKKKLLGPNASTIMGIVDSIGSKNTVRIRMRGVGSGYLEGPQHVELPEPLHFNVSTETEDQLKQALVKVKHLIQNSKAEMGYRN